MNTRTETRVPWRLSVAPMMDWTDRHCRYFHRLLAPDARLYTEMVVVDAVLRGDRQRLLAYDPAEHPVALQLGGADPARLATAARIAADEGYDEINLNVGCPSDRVQSGRFGACLMAEPALVADCVAAMRAAAVHVPVTVKTRLGIDDQDNYEVLAGLVGQVRDAGCQIFVVHARKAWLSGLSPKQNREVPPLDYPRVHRLKRDFPELTVILNGGIRDIETAQAELAHVDGVMLGRQAYEAPYSLIDFQHALIGGDCRHPPTRDDIVLAMADYAERVCSEPAGPRLWAIARHMLGLYAGQPGARQWRRYLSEACRDRDAGPEVLRRSIALVARAA